MTNHTGPGDLDRDTRARHYQEAVERIWWALGVMGFMVLAAAVFLGWWLTP